MNHTHKVSETAHIFHPVNRRRGFVIHPQFSREGVVVMEFLWRTRGRGAGDRGEGTNSSASVLEPQRIFILTFT